MSAPPTAGSTSTSSNKSSSPTRERSRCSRPWNYSIQDVPWVQFFKGSYGFHAAFWHNDFGHRRSHGCINLSPQDARYLFQFTQPILPPGWNAILPIAEDHPTTVQVR
ncbi:MAG: L,D-transpeptidase [Deltaproteobacteria bacterium]|nr:L,D-transpeptidase [Deltaproteobacteria bacterium]